MKLRIIKSRKNVYYCERNQIFETKYSNLQSIQMSLMRMIKTLKQCKRMQLLITLSASHICAPNSIWTIPIIPVYSSFLPFFDDLLNDERMSQPFCLDYKWEHNYSSVTSMTVICFNSAEILRFWILRRETMHLSIIYQRNRTLKRIKSLY